MAKKINKKMSRSRKVGVGLVVTTAVAAAAGAYFLYGAKGAVKNRKMVKGWVLKAKGEVLEGVEKVKHLNEISYHDLVDRVIKRYMKMKKVSNKEAKELQKELKSYWKHFHTMVSKTKQKAVKRVKKVSKKKTAKKKVAKRKTVRKEKK